jgi:hypothetical protein
MSECKYRIKEFPYNGKIVYSPQRYVGFFLWMALYYPGKGFHRLNNLPDFVNTKEEALTLIGKEKAKEAQAIERQRLDEEFARKFGPTKYECVD